MLCGKCALGMADDGGRGRRRQFGDVPAPSHPLRDGSMAIEGVGNTEPCSRTLVFPSHYTKLYGVPSRTNPNPVTLLKNTYSGTYPRSLIKQRFSELTKAPEQRATALQGARTTRTGGGGGGAGTAPTRSHNHYSNDANTRS